MHLAERWVQEDASEGAARCAVSRAYYAVYNLARGYAQRQYGFQPSGLPQDHRLLRREFREQGRGDIAASLDSLRQYRNSCDYSDEVPGVIEIVLPTAMEDARLIIGVVSIS